MKKSIVYVIITALLFVTLEPVSKTIANNVNPFAITFWRFLIGSIILLPPAIIKLKREKIKLTYKDILLSIFLGVLFICVSMTTLQLAVKQVDSPSLIAIIFSSNSIFTIILAVLIVKEKMNKFKILSLIFGIIGVLLCADFNSDKNLISVALSLLAAVSFSFYTVLSQKFMKKLGGLIQTALVFLSGSVVLLFILMFGNIDVTPSFTTNNILIMCYLGFFVTGIGYYCYFRAIEKGGAIMGSLAFFIKPILTPFATWIIQGISPDIVMFAAIVCIVIASYCAAYKK